ncbi:MULTISPECIES: putative baseplate assembly protein [Microbacterium]|uniref:Baseplate assembly protein n=1 Tax=Microbacterium wangchenii TaxID=2541726 RepID=A0ABX5SSR8_9MICO|nr:MULTISPECIES: putative baseplate assembly protein [Microbacterium]MCK6067925.1 putative baseplate assembly protein [Microbacterium sp. EYE_512]QBR89191.1 putative baseplate assembly protein [Microbacterium wangchenii]
MTLPAPRLDDRRFQDLVDDAKRFIAVSCPEWTDHNVSDPGVTLLEAFAQMVDELLYRLNRVPDRLYVEFLNLLGVSPHPPAAATTDIVFWLTAPRPHDVTIPGGTEAATRRTEDRPAVVFTTTDATSVRPRRLTHIGSQPADAEPAVRSASRLGDGRLDAFSPNPAVGDGLLFGLNDAAGAMAVRLTLDCAVRGVGVDPLAPTLRWEAYTGSDWTACDVVSDGTGGLNQAGEVLLVVPRSHAAATLGGVRAGWLRCRLIEADSGAPTYSASPVVRSASADAVGAVAPAVHATTVADEVLGLSEGVPGQQFPLAAHPVVADGTEFIVEVGAGAGWESWRETDTFAGLDAGERRITVDRSSGTVRFPPAVREPDGSLRAFGAVPPKGAPLVVRRYRIGGGLVGNLSAGSLVVVRSGIPFVGRCENRAAATGGADGETVEEAKVRGPLILRTRDRAVTPEDYEQLVRRSTPGVARVHCIPASESGASGEVRVLVVPRVAIGEDGRRELADLQPSAELLTQIRDELEPRRSAGARVLLRTPDYRGVTVVASLAARPRVAVASLRTAALQALYRYLDPLTGGADGTGWPFGRPLSAGELHAVLHNLTGTELVDEVLLFPADPDKGTRGEPTQRLEWGAESVPFSYEHRVRVTAGV